MQNLPILRTILNHFHQHTNFAKLKDGIAKRVNDLGYDWSTFTLPSFIQWLGDLEEKQILCMPVPMPPHMFGAWFSTEHRREYIFFEANTSSVHQAHIILHELGHHLLNHKKVTLLDTDLEAIRADPTGAYLRQLLERYVRCRSVSTRDSVEEQEAEVFGALVQEHVVLHARLNQLSVWQENEERLIPYFKAMELL